MANKFYVLPEYSGILSFIDAIFFHLNVGLLIYHMEKPNDPKSLRLIYANDQASRYTGTDLQCRVGRYLGQAFPQLEETDVPAAFAEVVQTKQAREIGIVRYSDDNVERADYRVKAFPMPSSCVGVLFENPEKSDSGIF